MVTSLKRGRRCALLPSQPANWRSWNDSFEEGLFQRQENLKTCIARFRFKANIAPVFSNNARDRIQPKPGSLADRLGCKEWLEDAQPQVRRYSRAVVPDLHHNVRRLSPGTHLKRAPFRHRIHSINDQIGPNQIKFAAIGLNAWQPF